MAAARAYAAQMTLLEQRGVGTAPRITLGDYLRGWLEVKIAEVEPNTAAGYKRWIGHLIRHDVSRQLLDRITPLVLEQCYRDLLTISGWRGKPLSAVSVRHCATVLTNALNDAVRQQRLPSNPAIYAKAPKGQSPQMVIPDAAQIGALLDELAGYNPELADLGG